MKIVSKQMNKASCIFNLNITETKLDGSVVTYNKIDNLQYDSWGINTNYGKEHII